MKRDGEGKKVDFGSLLFLLLYTYSTISLLLLILKLKKKISNSFISHCVEVGCARENSISLIEYTIRRILYAFCIMRASCSGSMFQSKHRNLKFCNMWQRYGTWHTLNYHRSWSFRSASKPLQVYSNVRARHFQGLSRYLLWYAHNSKFSSDPMNCLECNLHFDEHLSLRDASNGGISCDTFAPIVRSNAEK